MTQRTIVGWGQNKRVSHWVPTTLDKVGKDESFFENILVESPELLGLETRRSGIRGPMKIFQQVGMETPSGRSIYPDIVMFASSGHVVVVEVKRYANPELRDRAVIAQIIDYASSFASLSESQCVELFGQTNHNTWTDVVAGFFPTERAVDELADVLLNRMQNGELNLVIACDKIPPGLPEVVSGIAAQRTLGFDLDLVEVTPFVREVSPDGDIIFVPSIRLSTEIVSRTAVTITYRAGDAQPTTNVQTTSLESIEQNLREAKRPINPDAKMWTPQEVEEEFQRVGDPTALLLLEFVKQHSSDGEYVTSGRKVNARFSFLVRGITADNTLSTRVLLNCVKVQTGVQYHFNLGEADNIVSPKLRFEYRNRLKSIFGDEIEVQKSWVALNSSSLSSRLFEFQEFLLWFKQQGSSSLEESQD